VDERGRLATGRDGLGLVVFLGVALEQRRG
jgi:hypothetical protein